MQTKNKNLILASVAAVSTVILSGCFSARVSEKSVIDYSFSAFNPVDQTLVLSGNLQDQAYSPEKSQIFSFLKGAKQGETKTGTLQDPFQKHDPLQVQKISVDVLNQLSINPQVLGEEIQIGDKTFIFAGTGSEEGLVFAKLDTNPIETTIPLVWTFTIDKIN